MQTPTDLMRTKLLDWFYLSGEPKILGNEILAYSLRDYKCLIEQVEQAFNRNLKFWVTKVLVDNAKISLGALPEPNQLDMIVSSRGSGIDSIDRQYMRHYNIFVEKETLLSDDPIPENFALFISGLDKKLGQLDRLLLKIIPKKYPILSILKTASFINAIIPFLRKMMVLLYRMK